MTQLTSPTVRLTHVSAGPQCLTNGGVSFRVWAPDRKSVEVIINGNASPLEPERDGYFAGTVQDAGPGTLYVLRLDGGDTFPDPASRFQPDGPHGPSEVIDTQSFRWTDHDWKGVSLAGQVLYELHIGTFTPEGTWRSAMSRLPKVAELGVTVLEVMPIADFPGDFGWGYDGVALYAPYHRYGRPEDFAAFIDLAHSLGLGVILDVVYNHLGPDGNFLQQFAKAYFSDKHETDWGAAINFDGSRSGPVRDFFSANAAYWVRDYHLDGLRLDATQRYPRLRNRAHHSRDWRPGSGGCRGPRDDHHCRE